MERKLTAILAPDVVVYSRLMEADEGATIRMLDTYRQVRAVQGGSSEPCVPLPK